MLNRARWSGGLPSPEIAPSGPVGSWSRAQSGVVAVWACLALATLVAPAPWLALGAGAVLAMGAIAVSVRVRRPQKPWTWWAIVGAITLFLVGNVLRQAVYSSLTEITGGRSLVPDAIIVPGYLLLASGLVGFVREREKSRHGVGIVLDGLMAGLALLACCWVFLVEPHLAHRDVGTVVRLVLAFYPAASLFLVVVMLQIGFGSGRLASRVERCVVVSVSAMFAGDVVSMLASLQIVNSPRFIDLAYVTAFSGASAGALDRSMRRLTEPAHGTPPSWPLLRIGLVAVALSVPAVLVLQSNGERIAPRLVLFVIISMLTATAILQILRALRVAERSEGQLRYQALHDALTGLPNRRMMEQHLEGVLGAPTSGERSVGILFLDLDRFKLINDTVGHSLGDQLLVQVAERLAGSVRAGDLVARIGGDEFVVVLGWTRGLEESLEIANRLRACLRSPFIVDSTEFFVTASIGLACAPSVGAGSAEILIRDADTAMYRAKEAGRDAVAVFDDTMRAQLAERVEMERDLRHAVDRGQLHLAFQPVVSSASKTIVSVEALVRWLHPSLGVIMPSRFIPLAEETDLIVDIGSWVLDEALRQVALCRTLPGLEDLRVAVNLSAVQLRDEMLVEHVGRVLSAHGLPGSALCLELTETVVMGDPEMAMAAFAALRRLDVRIAIDDFGTEYSSLAYLQRLPVDTLKIDRSFVAGMGESESAADTLVEAIVAIARALGMETIAEGVETVDQAKRLERIGCDALQGYLYSRPVRAEQLVDVVRLLSRDRDRGQEPSPQDLSGADAVA